MSIDSNIFLYLFKKVNKFQFCEICGNLLVGLVQLKWVKICFWNSKKLLKNVRQLIYFFFLLFFLLDPGSAMEKHPDPGSRMSWIHNTWVNILFLRGCWKREMSSMMLMMIMRWEPVCQSTKEPCDNKTEYGGILPQNKVFLALVPAERGGGKRQSKRNIYK